MFVTPGGQVLGAPKGMSLELAAKARLAPSAAKSGTMEGWYGAVDAAMKVPGCEHWILGVLAGFVGPIAARAHLDTCGINLSGLSSGGKTLAQRLAVSAWTSPVLGTGLLQSLRTTENHSHTLAFG